jgi:selenocysteine lyase/cysteine desulfurase
MLNEEQLAEVRSHFPILREKTYLYSCSQGALSDAAEAGMKQYAESWRTSAAPWDEWVQTCEALRSEFARFINAELDEVAITTSASAGINPIANALDFKQRNKVVMGEYEFPTMGQIWLAQKARGAEIQFLDGINNQVPVESYARAIDERTAIVPLTHVSFVNGSRSDVAAITKLAHDRGALLFLDGFQDCGTRSIDVKALDVDFYVTGTLKYLLGPPGIAFLYLKKSLVESLNPPITSWLAQRDAFSFNAMLLDPAPNARRFEGGSPPVPNVYMARPALHLLVDIGLENVAWQVERLTRAFLEGVHRLGLDTKTPASSVGPLVVVRAKDVQAVSSKLAERGVVISTRGDGARFAFHVYNTVEDVEVALAVLKENIDLLVRT